MRHWFIQLILLMIVVLSGLVSSGCANTSHPVAASELGQPARWRDVEQSLGEPGPIRFSKVTAADWEVDLSGLLNLEHPVAKEAGLSDRAEPIQVYFYVLEHPTYGTHLIDTGIARSVARRSDEMPVSWLVRKVMNLDALQVHVDTASWLEKHRVRVRGVFLTHLHLDHILGLQDMPKETPIYVGPGEAQHTQFQHLFSRSTTNANLDGFGPLQELQAPKAEGEPFGVIDVFGDRSFFAIHLPGHTEGHLAYVVRSTAGPQLVVGDSCHTAWGWKNGVEPGTFNADGERAARSFQKLRAFAAAHPGMQIHLGHQELPSERPKNSRGSP